jgi:hypothetical protein
MTNMLKLRNLADIFNETFKIYAKDLLRLLTIVAIPELSFLILAFAGGPLAGFIPEHLWVQLESSDPSVAILVFGIMTALAVLLGYILVYLMLEGALIYAVAEQNLPQTVNVGPVSHSVWGRVGTTVRVTLLGVGRAYCFAWGRLGAMLGATVLAGLAMIVMFITIIGIPVAIYFSIGWFFILQVVVLEGLGPRAALSRSAALVKGNWWRVWGIICVMGIIAGLIEGGLGITLETTIAGIFSVPISVMSELLDSGLATELGATIAGIVSVPILTVASTLLYYDLRAREEEHSRYDGGQS